LDLLQHYGQLVGYDAWANLEMIAALRAAESFPERPLKLIAHIIAAEYLWRARMLQEKPPLAVWPELALEECDQQARKLPGLWLEFLSKQSAGGLEERVAYKNSKGEAYRSTVRDILTHVFMHSAYHRGQIAADMRQAGHVPAYTDFIHGVRQGLID
jgi:uncharacterized damage-inducible protein DinB